jgi:multicomponent Na+:H+ antiporter subunit E
MAGSTPPGGAKRTSGPAPDRVSLLAPRAALGAAIWWLLSGGDPASWSVGIPCVLLAVLASRTLSPHRRLRVRVRGVPAFVGLFVAQTIRGSVDVAWRALHPRMSIDPDLVDYVLRFPAGPGRLLFASTVNLLPGTVCVEIERDRVRLHVIARSADLDAQLETLERRVAAMLADPAGDRA